MENRHTENTPPEEQQGWGAYATPPPLPGQQNRLHSELSPDMSLCARVRERMPDLLENDGSIRPEVAHAIYDHLAVCPGCAREFEEMGQVIRAIASLGQVQMPADYSGLIMRRIQLEYGPAGQGAPPRPTFAASSLDFGGAANVTPEIAASAAATTAQTTAVTVSRTQTHVGLGTLVLPHVNTWERLTLTGIFSALTALLFSTGWGRQMLGANLASVQAWFGQIGEALRRTPVLNWLVASILATLAQAGDLLNDTAHSLGGTAAINLALEIAVCASIGFFLLARRKPGQMRGI